MSDECLITLETVFSYCYDCQAVMRKFTLAGKTINADGSVTVKEPSSQESGGGAENQNGGNSGSGSGPVNP